MSFHKEQRLYKKERIMFKPILSKSFAVLAAGVVLLAVFSEIRGADQNAFGPNRILTNDVRINDDTGTANQYDPAIAMHRYGPLVIAWTDRRNGGQDIYFQLFSRRGQPFGTLGNVKVNDAGNPGMFSGCDVAMDGRGHFIVVFGGGPTGQFHSYAQWYLANGKPFGGNVRVDDGPDGSFAGQPVAAACDLGTSVVAWIDGRDDAKGDIWIQRFNRDGSRWGSNVRIAATRDSAQVLPAVGMDARGNFVLAWMDGMVRSRVMARLFDLGGTAVGAEFQVAPQPGDGMAECYIPAVAVSRNGGFALFWLSHAAGGEILRQARLFDSAGQPVTNVFRVDEPGKFAGLSDLSVAAYPRGGMTAFAWSAYESGDVNVYARSCTASGAFSIPSALVNDRPGMQLNSDVTVDDVGNTVFAWQDDRNTNDDVYATWTGPKRPNYVTAGSGYNGMVPLSWEPWYGQNIRTQYRITRFESPGGVPALIATVDPSSRPFPDRMLDFVDTTAENGRTYYYGIENITDGSSGPSYATATPMETGHAIQSAWSGGEPLLDGVLSPGEWDDAAIFDIANPHALFGIRLFIKNSNDTLYMAVDDSNDVVLEPATTLGILFDLENNGKWAKAGPSPEGMIAMTPSAAAFSGFWGSYPDHLGGDAPKAVAGIVHAISKESGHVQYEVAIDLNASPLKAAAGQTVGFAAWVNDPGNFYGYHYGYAGEWPLGALWEAAETLGKLTLASETGLAVRSAANPESFRLDQNYPNPFNPETMIRFHVKKPGRVTLKIHDLSGRDVATLADAPYSAGSHAVRFDASGLPSGIYVYTITMGNFTASRKMAVMK
jgi:hypothetical protein